MVARRRATKEVAAWSCPFIESVAAEAALRLVFHGEDVAGLRSLRAAAGALIEARARVVAPLGERAARAARVVDGELPVDALAVPDDIGRDATSRSARQRFHQEALTPSLGRGRREAAEPVRVSSWADEEVCLW